MTDNVSGVILAGGRSRRMGRAKAFLPWPGGTLVEHVAGTLRSCVSDVLVVAKQTQPFEDLGLVAVQDRSGEAAVMLGLHSGLFAVSSDYAFVCGCDMPLLNPELIRFLFSLAPGFDLVMPETGAGPEPLHAVYGAGCLDVIERRIERGDLRMQSLAGELRTRIVPESEWIRVDPDGRSFRNLNTVASYDAAYAATLSEDSGR